MVLPKHELEGKLGEERLLIESGLLRDENSLDLSVEFTEFLLACRDGDLRRCRELINQGVNVNGKDEFDHTPLFMASMCGHYKLVQLLLESGALAEKNTVQGERCIRNAFNGRIRSLLLRYDFNKSADPYVYWSTHLSSLLERETPATSDMCLVAGPRSFRLHRFFLFARTSYFRDRLDAQPETTSWNLPPGVPPEAVHIALRNLYLDHVPTDLAPSAGSSSVSEDDIAKGHRDEEERALQQIGNFFRDRVLGGKMVVDTDRVSDVRIGSDNTAFADVLLRADELSASCPPLLNSQGISQSPRMSKSVLYPCHKAMLIRSKYFATMFSGDFIEAQTSDHLHIVTVDCSPAVLELVLSYLYTDGVRCPLEHALDLLYTADMLCLDSLKTKAAVAISTLGSGNAVVDGDEQEPINIYDVIHAAWTLRVQRLEQFAARYLADRLEDYIDDSDFHELVRESAPRIRRREETDSIELLDDIRFYLWDRFRLRYEDAGIIGVISSMTANGRIPTRLILSGDADKDAFDSAAGQYRELQQKIDDMLESLKLDA
ncbi:ankyrin repeat and BTB/POZ domain-containing protein 1 [Ophiocordyceps camponoti-floridani]|uniref:Ankyrin repeat and BTB/POZ domain-containing protein 1 n=1 Tax=Ophiocordyceps camponoti-floridani TaxID=2030778 RepID=A0A8H4Q5L5_9HYPO|nr:ankyrin repeat and BTB/POZ domain-containing protein 1 [Ophiocordyceps camponoti-floridani]